MCKYLFLAFVFSACCCVVGIYCGMFNIPNDFSPHIGKFFIAAVTFFAATLCTLPDPYAKGE